MNHHALLPPATASIPLHCNICPKKPDFSDVSHLLTHIASKGHLSHYYKMKVQASTDPGAKQVVDEYDEWYDEWNVQDLMRERMSQKERKKGGANGNANGGSTSRRGSAGQSPIPNPANEPVEVEADASCDEANSVASATSRNTPVSGIPTGRRTHVLRENMLDPQLDRRVKSEPKSRSTTPLPFTLDPAALHRAYAPPMQSWPATPYADSPITQERSVLGSLYSTPSSESPEIELPRRSTARNKQRNLSGSNESQLADDEPEYDDGQSEVTKLKGVYWDGMGMFDSATPEMRRKRNQKKATSVVEQLQATSEVVEATECVFDAQGELRRERPITGNPESDDGMSPLKGESTPEPDFPPKKKAGRRPRQALVEKDVNTGRSLRRRGESHHPPFSHKSSQGPYFGGVDEEDDELTYGKPPPRKRTGLSIHRDNSGPDITFDNPAPMNTLTSAFRHPFQTAPVQQRSQVTYPNGYLPRGHQRQPSFPLGSGFRPAGNNPFGALQPPNFGSFGQLSGHSMFQNPNFHHNAPFPASNGHQAFAAFQQQFGVGQQPFGNDGSVFQGQNNGGVQTSSSWDIFGLGHQDMGITTTMDPGFNVNADFTTVNPLFFSSNHGVPEDDEATISPPNSEHQSTQ